MTCKHTLFNCNCWYVVSPQGVLIHRAESFDKAKEYKDAQPDASELKLTPWGNGRELQERA